MKDQTETSTTIRRFRRNAPGAVKPKTTLWQNGTAGLDGAHGDADKVLETVVNNLEVTNDLDIQPEIRCRVLMTSTLESFTIGHTIVLSRGLVDVLPDEASLAAILAHELGHVVLGHRMDTEFAFSNRLRFDEKETFRHFGLRAHRRGTGGEPEGDRIAEEVAVQGSARNCAALPPSAPETLKEIPNLISPHLGDRYPDKLDHCLRQLLGAADAAAKPAANVIAALPLGGRIKIEPWNDQLRIFKSKPVGAVAEYEKKPFEVTPFVVYLTRPRGKPSEVAGAIPLKSGDADDEER